MKVTEGIAGYWHYHISEDGQFQSLCGKPVMNTSIPLDQYGIPFGEHLTPKPRYC